MMEKIGFDALLKLVNFRRPRWRLVIIALATAAITTCATASSEDDIPPGTSITPVVNAFARAKIIADLNRSLARLGKGVRIVSCSQIYDYVQPMPSGHDTSFGAICKLRSGAEVLMCDDRMVGKFSMTEAFSGGTETVGIFTALNCPPGG